MEAAKTGARVNPKDGLNYVLIPAGKFRMSCSPGDADCTDREGRRMKCISAKAFGWGKTHVTQAAWKRVMNSDASHFKGDQLRWTA